MRYKLRRSIGTQSYYKPQHREYTFAIRNAKEKPPQIVYALIDYVYNLFSRNFIWTNIMHPNKAQYNLQSAIYLLCLYPANTMRYILAHPLNYESRASSLSISITERHRYTTPKPPNEPHRVQLLLWVVGSVTTDRCHECRRRRESVVHKQ